MTKEEKIKCAIEKGFTCDPLTGKVYGVRGKEILSKDSYGYIPMSMQIENKKYYFFAHQFIWYWVNNEVVDCIDHINRNKIDNRIENLRAITHEKNLFNRECKGYYLSRKKWRVRIQSSGKRIDLGSFDNEEDARQAYLEAKKIHHII